MLAKPNLSSFKSHEESHKIMKKACKHFVFGGSVFESLRLLVDGKLTEKPNKLMKAILRSSVPS